MRLIKYNWSSKIILVGVISLLTVQAQAVKVLKLSHNQGPEVPVHHAMQYFADKVKEYTNGELVVRLYTNGQLGTQRESLELVQNGSLAFAKSNASELEAFEPLYGVLNLPYIFKSREQFYKVLNSKEVGEKILNASKDKGFIGITFYDAGSRSFYGKKAFRSPADLKDVKVRVQPSPTAVRMVKLLGGDPTPISWGELYTALQQGVVDAAENNESALTDARHGEIAKFYSRDEHTMIPDVLVMSSKIWDSLTPEQQKAIKKAGKESMIKQKELWTQHANEAIKKAQDKLGVTFIKIDKKPFIEKVEPMYEEAAKASPEIGQLIQKIKEM
ncbi:MAG: TRAP transporter substrate-binding protein [Ostreibacterium sp.]